jgi:hypothetical protein
LTRIASQPSPPIGAPPGRDLGRASCLLGAASIPASLLLLVLSNFILPYEPGVWVGRAILGLGGVVAPLVGLVLGAVALVRSRRLPSRVGQGRATAGLLISALSLLPLLLLLAVVLLQLSGRRARQEAAAVGDVRTVVAAEKSYYQHCGFYGRLECLSQPSECIAGYTGPSFLDPTPPSLATRRGYARRLYPGREAPSTASCRSGFQTFAYVAVPEAARWQRGGRGFCGDDREVFTSTADGSEPAVSEGRCAGGGAAATP